MRNSFGKQMTKYLDKRGKQVTKTQSYNSYTQQFATFEGTPYQKGMNVVSKSALYTAVNNDYIIECDGTFTVNLYAVSGNSGNVLKIKNKGTGTITVDPDGAETIDGVSTFALYQDEAIEIYCNGTDWRIL